MVTKESNNTQASAPQVDAAAILADQSLTARAAEIANKANAEAVAAAPAEPAPASGPAPAGQAPAGQERADVDVPEEWGDWGQQLFRCDPNNEADALIRQASEDAKIIREQADRDAAITRAMAQSDRDEILAKAKEEGYNAGLEEGREEARRQGLEEGRAEGHAEVEETINELKYFIEALKMERMQTCKEEENQVANLAFEVAKKVIRQQIQVDRDTIPHMIEEIAKEVENPVRLVLSEFNETYDFQIDDYTIERIKELLPGIKVSLVSDGDTDGIIQLETADGLIDAGIGSQLERLREATIDSEEAEEEELPQ